MYTQYDLDIAIFKCVPHLFQDQDDEQLMYTHGTYRTTALFECGRAIFFGDVEVDEETKSTLREAYRDLQKGHFNFAPESDITDSIERLPG